MQESSGVPMEREIGSVSLLMMRYEALRASAVSLGGILQLAEGMCPRKLARGECAAFLPAVLTESYLLLHPYEAGLAGMADVFLRLKAGIERRVLDFCSAQQRALIEAEYRRLASEIRRRAARLLPAEVQRVVHSVHAGGLLL